MNIEIINPDNLPEEFVIAEIKQFERETKHKVRKAEFYDMGDGNAKEKFFLEPIRFDRLRRITGYLAYLDKFNEPKQAEEKERVKHK